MAWWGVDKGSEPLMHLERPSTGSSQTTAHVILAFFNDVLVDKSVESNDGNNLAVANVESGSTSEFRKYYVDRLKKIADDCSEQLEELSRVEQHLLEAKAKALEDDEHYIEELSKSCPTYNDIQLPHAKSRMSQYIDEQLLEQHNLLLPSKYLERPLSLRLPPKSSIQPQYLNSTLASRQHTCERSDNELHLPPIHTGQSLQQKKSGKDYWKSYLSVPDRLSEKSALAGLMEKTAFSRNPKYSEKEVSSISSYGAAKIRRRELNHLVIEPAEVLFTNYRPGEAYQSQIMVTNVSAVSRLVRLTHFDSPYFSISPGDFPCGDNMIAPGMRCTFTVTFKPDSLGDFSEIVQFAASSGQYLKVALRGVRPAPILSLPRELDCGGCLVENNKSCIFTCENSGGEGTFHVLLPVDCNVTGEEKYQESESIVLSPFVISPRKFYIGSGNSVNLAIVFSPHRTGQHMLDLVLACDNGSTATYTLSGLSEKVNVGCTRVRPSLSTEKLSFISSSSPSEALMIQASMFPDQDDREAEKVMSTPVVEFPPVCPKDASFQTIIIKNFSNVNLPFTWQYYRPIVSPSDKTEEDDNKPIADTLEVSECCPFLISPASGVLPPAKHVAFVARFNPDHLGDFVDMAYLTLTGGFKMAALDSSEENVGWLCLSESCVSIVCLQLHGIARPYQLEMIPPAWIIPGKIPFATEFKRQLKVVNRSHSEVRLQWAGHSDDVVAINVKPSIGLLGLGESCSFEVLTVANGEGPFRVTAWCSVDGSLTHIPFQVFGCIEGPIVELSPGRLHFGLLPVGYSLTQKIAITNTSNRIINFKFQQLVQERSDGFVDYECLIFKPSEGKVLPRKSISAVVECTGLHAGKLRTILQLLVNNLPHKCMFVEADVQIPSICLESCKLHMEDAYVGIPCQHQIVLMNKTVIPTQFIWKAQVLGADGKHCRIDVGTMTGRLGPRQSISIPIEITWTAKGQFKDIIIMCEVVGSSTPVLLSLSASVKGLSVIYHLLQNPKEEEICPDVESRVPSLSSSMHLMPMPFPLHPDTRRPMLDYGHEVELRKPVTKTISITNQSAIPTTLEAYVTNFPCARWPKSESSTGRSKKVLLKRTQNTISSDATNINPGSQYLSDGRGACFVVEPSCVGLQAFETIHLTVTAYADMWGQYTDQLYFKISGLEDHIIDIKMVVAGCPVYFQATGIYGYTVLRFGSHLGGSKTVKRIIKMKNDAPVDLQINWSVFNVELEDNQLVDFFTYYSSSIQHNSHTPSCILSNKEEKSINGSKVGTDRDDWNGSLAEDQGEDLDLGRNEKEIDEKIGSEGGYNEREASVSTIDDGEKVGKEKHERQEIHNVIDEKNDIKPNESFIVGDNEDEIISRKLTEASLKELESQMKAYDEISEHKEDIDGEELGVPLVRKQGEWSLHLLKEQMNENTSHDKLSVNEIPHVMLKIHEGVPAKSPFIVSPRQMVIPSRGQATVVATFKPADEDIDLLGPTPCGFALGYMNIVNELQSSIHTERVHGYAVAPLRIDMMAGIDKSELLMDCQEGDGLQFAVPASLLLKDDLKIQERASDVHHFTLTNTGTSIMSFKLFTHSSHFQVCRVQDSDHHGPWNQTESICSQSFITIRPQETIQFIMTFSFTIQDIRGSQASSGFSDTLTYSEELQIVYSTGHIQKFPVSAVVYLPELCLSKQEDFLGTCLLDSCNATSFMISNSSMSSAALWTISILEENVVKIFPESGRLLPCKSTDKLDSQTVQVIFTPRSEAEISCCLLIKEELTQQAYSLNIKGVGSADEQYSL